LNILSRLLSEYRKLHKLTQKDLVKELSQFSTEYSALNTVTLSRWETGTTSPSLHKKRTLLNFFASKGSLKSGKCHNAVKERYENLYEPLSEVFIRNYQALIGNFPEQKNVEYILHSLKDSVQNQERFKYIIDIETASNPEKYYTPTPEILAQWCDHPSSFAITCEQNKQHLGHFIMFKIKNSVAEAIAHHKRSEFSLTEDDFCDVDEKGTCYVHALYGRSPKIAAVVNVEAYLHLFEHMDTIDNMMIFSTRTDGVLLTKDYGIEMLAQGKDEEYGFEWHGMLSPVEDILFSDTVLKLIF